MICDLRAAKPADADALALVGAATFLETYAGQLPGAAITAHCTANHSSTAWHELLMAKTTEVWLAEAPGSAPVGYAALTLPDIPGQQESDLELRRIYLLSSWHGRGIGGALLTRATQAAAKRGARRMLLGVWAQNRRALGFYAAHGFHKIATRRFQVGPMMCDDYVLARQLVDESSAA
jgi:ribosomal protein S18 acetylase RimI-like enzyme